MPVALVAADTHVVPLAMHACPVRVHTLWLRGVFWCVFWCERCERCACGWWTLTSLASSCVSVSCIGVGVVACIAGGHSSALLFDTVLHDPLLAAVSCLCAAQVAELEGMFAVLTQRMFEAWCTRSHM
jgi:hypothetical protein